MFYICSIDSHQTFRRRNLLAHREANDPRLPVLGAEVQFASQRIFGQHFLKNLHLVAEAMFESPMS